jgi:hypothetical protein
VLPELFAQQQKNVTAIAVRARAPTKGALQSNSVGSEQDVTQDGFERLATVDGAPFCRHFFTGTLS